jgi:HlyD family secretion protein
VEGPREIVALGRVEPAGGVISISAIPGERLQQFEPGVSEGGTVRSGQLLGRLASLDMRQTQYEAYGTRLELARLQRTHDLAVAQAHRDQAAAAVAQAKAKLEEMKAQRLTLSNLGEAAEIAQDDLRRLAILRETDPELVTDHQFRRQENQAARARLEYEAAELAYGPGMLAAQMSVEAAMANLSLAEKSIVQIEEVDTTRAIAMEQKVAAETLEQSQLKAPGNPGDGGTYHVLKILMEPGEFVTQIPVLQLGDLSRMVCVAEVYEADVKEIQVGQSARIHSPAFGGDYATEGIAGKVLRIGSMVSNPDLESRNPLAPVDRSVIDVVVELDPTDSAATAEAASRIGLQVTVEFLNSATSHLAQSIHGGSVETGAAIAPTSSKASSGDSSATKPAEEVEVSLKLRAPGG